MAFLSIHLLAVALLISSQTISAQLSTTFYDKTCPNVDEIVRETMIRAVKTEPRMGASLLRLFFHDCFVQGCDASILLDDTPTMIGEKNAEPNQNSIRGFEVIDAIKSNLEKACESTVSCADIIALAARDAVELLGGPTWQVKLGRRDSTHASIKMADSELPKPNSPLSILISQFAKKGLTARQMAALSGAHSIGKAHCSAYRKHIYNDTNIDPNFAKSHKMNCPLSGGDDNMALFDESNPSYKFDNSYYKNLLVRKGLLHSDQELFNHGSMDNIVKVYSSNEKVFFKDFVRAIHTLGSFNLLTGTRGQIRVNCRRVN